MADEGFQAGRAEAARRPDRSPGVTVQELLARDSRPVPAVLRQESCVDLGCDPIPKERYFSRQWHDLEVERLWKRVWQVACREEELPEVGDHVVYDVADSSLIVVRTAPDRIQAFHNACLHRGTTLRTEGGSVRRFRCPFHGFTWRLDGTLESIPAPWDFPHVDPAGFALPEALVDTWGGWVFVNMDRQAGPLAEFLGGFPAAFPWDQAALFTQAHVAKVLPCNWKVALEAFIESFHVVATHPQLLRTLGDSNTQYDVWPDEPRWNRMITAQAVSSPHLGPTVSQQDVMDALVAQFMGEGATFPLSEGRTARETMAELVRGRLTAALGPDAVVSDSEAVDAIEYYVFPNFVPWGGWSRINYRFRPHGNDPDACVMDVYLLAPFDPTADRPAPAPVHALGADDEWSEAPELGMLAAIFTQDSANLPRVQRGVRAMTTPGAVLGNYQEVRIRHYHRELERWVTGEAPPTS